MGQHVLSQQTPCTATSITPSTDGVCSLSASQTAPATVNTWSTNGAGGVSAGLVSTCNGTQTAASGNLWYTVTAPASGSLNLITQFDNSGGGNMQNPEWQIYQQTGGTCASSNMTLNYLGCGTNGVSTSTTMTPGATYYIRLFDDNADRDLNGEKYKYCFSFRAVNGSCATAQAITPGTTVSGSTTGSTLSDPPFTGGGWCPTGTVWYTFNTGATPGCYSMYYQNATTGCNYVTVYQGGCPGSGGTLVNNNVSTNAYNDQGSSEWGGMLPNTTYTVAVSNATPTSTFSFNVRPSTPTASNDQCSSPAAINTTPVLTDNAVAGCEYSYVGAQDANIVASNICAGTLENISWYQFVASATGAPIVITFANITCNNGGGGFQSGLFRGSNCASLTVGLTGTAICAAGASGTLTYTIPAGSVVAGNTYFIAMDGNAGSNCHFTISGTNLAPLPIELMNFYISSANIDKVDLAWSTATEINNLFFTIERSYDGENFNEIGKVAGAINSTEQRDYRFSDLSPKYGTTYSRLKQTDYDGTETYSSTSSIILNEFENFNFKAFPNPSSSEENIFLQFSSEKSDLVEMDIYDFKGIQIFHNEFELNKDVTTIELHEKFESGVYIIKCKNSFGETITRKISIQ